MNLTAKAYQNGDHACVIWFPGDFQPIPDQMLVPTNTVEQTRPMAAPTRNLKNRRHPNPAACYKE